MWQTIGLVSPTSVPFTSIPLGKTTFQITTSVGRSLQTYDLLRGLNLVFLSRPQTPQTITATCAYKDKIFVAWSGPRQNHDKGVWVFKRGRVIGELEFPESVQQKIHNILIFGSWIVGCGSQAIEIWKNGSHEHYTTIRPPEIGGRGSAVLIGPVCTLPTFLNKIFV